MVLYYITDRTQFSGDEPARRERLLAKISEAACCGVDYIQLREKDLSGRQLENLANEAVRIVRQNSAQQEAAAAAGRPATRLLINSRSDIALGCGADGVHLTATDIPAGDARVIWSKTHANVPKSHLPLATADWFVAVSCHTPEEVRMAEAQGADFAVFGPVFEKQSAPRRAGAGLSVLRQACAVSGAPPNVEGLNAGRMPVLALGGVTLENAAACVAAGAAGVAAIRLFQENDIAAIVKRLRVVR